MPAALAAATALFIASGLARVTAMPSTRSAIASRTRSAWPLASGSFAYVSAMPSLAAAACAPFCTSSQNASLGAPWVIRATLIPAAPALPAVSVSAPASDPPKPEQPDAKRQTAAMAEARAVPRRDLSGRDERE
jgi:hypothetical protein